MSWSLSRIYRHPVKSLGQEALDGVALTPGHAMPFDRAWAVAHGGSDWDPAAPAWLHCRNFVTQRHVAALAKTSASFDDASGVLTLTHPDHPDLAIKPGTDEGAAALTEWLSPMSADKQKGPYTLAHAPGISFTDGDDCHLSLASLASRRALEERVGQPLADIRFRMNLWLDGPNAWEELGMEGQEITIGEVRLKVLSRCARCNATNANPETGAFDTQIPRILQDAYGHMDFGVNVQVVAGGEIKIGDSASLV